MFRELYLFASPVRAGELQTLAAGNMTAKEIANIVLRLLGALWCVSALLSVPSMFVVPVTSADIPTRAFIISATINAALSFAAGAALLVWSRPVAASLFPSPQELSIAATAPELQEVGFSLLAVYFAIEALSRIGGLTYTALQHEAWQDESRLEYLWRMNREGVISASVTLLAAIVLFFGSAQLAAFWHRVRGRQARRAPESAGGG